MGQVTTSTEAPTGLHVHILSSGSRMPASPPESWHRYLALYSERYPWVMPTDEERAEYAANNPHLATPNPNRPREQI